MKNKLLAATIATALFAFITSVNANIAEAKTVRVEVRINDGKSWFNTYRPPEKVRINMPGAKSGNLPQNEWNYGRSQYFTIDVPYNGMRTGIAVEAYFGFPFRQSFSKDVWIDGNRDNQIIYVNPTG